MALLTSDDTQEIVTAPDVGEDESSRPAAAEQDSSTPKTASDDQNMDKDADNEQEIIIKTKELKDIKFVDPFWWLSTKQKHQATCSSLVIGISLCLVFDIVVLMPYYYKEFNTPAMRHLCLQLFFYFNVMGNFLFIMLIGNKFNHRKGCVMSDEEKPGWRYCDECKKYLPPRSHHCSVCNFCVLKRDHHCVFTGTCVSLVTHRYFLMLLFHFLLGGIYNLFYLFEIFWSCTNENALVFLLSLTLPQLAFERGEIELLGYFLAVIEVLGILITTVVTVLFAVQFYAVARGQTLHELGEGITTYDCGYLQNIRNALGVRWYLVWLSPTIRSPLPGEYGDLKKLFEKVRSPKRKES